jgi:integrase/recombinase XerD
VAMSGAWCAAVLLMPVSKRRIGCHTFRATGITDYLTNGGRIEVAQRMAGHSNAKTTGLYDRRNDDISVGEVERIGI